MVCSDGTLLERLRSGYIVSYKVELDAGTSPPAKYRARTWLLAKCVRLHSYKISHTLLSQYQLPS